MRSRKELLAKRRELKKEIDRLVAKQDEDKKNASKALHSFIRFAQAPAELGLLNWILNKPTARQLKGEAMMKQFNKNNKKK